MKHLLYLLLFACLISCTPKQEIVEEDEDVEGEGYEPYYSLVEAEATDVPSDTSQIVFINKKGAIPVYPDTVWINEQQKTMDEETLSTMLDDYTYYQTDAIDTLQSRGVNIYDPIEKRYYKFKLPTGDFVMDLQKIRGEFGIILFNGKDIPTFCQPMEVVEVMDSLIID